MTVAQQGILDRAAGRQSGQLERSVRETSLEIMSQNGWIERRFRISATAERLEVEQARDSMIVRAAESLQDGRWKAALTGLQLAQDNQYSLDAMAWYITDKGRAAIESRKAA